jgi:hypothetical protein
MGDYPRNISLDADTKQRLVSYLNEQLTNHEAERGEFLSKLIRWQKEYWAEPITEKATFPFTGAATIVIPLAAIGVEAIHARNMTTMFALSQLVSTKSHDDKYADMQEPLEKLFNREFIKGMRFEENFQSPALEFVKFGTGVGKSGYEKIVRKAVRPTAEGKEEEFSVITKQGPTFDGVPLNRYLLPYAANDPQQAPWTGEYHSRTAFEVINLINSSFFAEGTREALESWLVNTAAGSSTVDTTRKFEESQATLEKREAVWPNNIDWAEIWLAFDVDQSGEQKEIVVHYHRASETLMSVRYNWNSDLRRPYRFGQFMPVEHRWTGIGICKQTEQFQKEVTTQHRQRLDNATLANMRMIKISKMAGYGPKEPIFPGKMWFLDKMEDMESIQMGEIYPSAYNNETSTLQYYQQRIGINEANLGMPQVGTPGTATSDLARIQEGNKKHDYSYRNLKRFGNELVLDAVCNIHQFGPRSYSYLQDSSQSEQLQQFFELPIETIREGCCIEVVLAAQQQNKLVDRQNYQQVLAGVTQYYTELMNLATNTQNIQLMQLIAQKAPIAATEVMKQMLETFDMAKIDKLILSELLNAKPATQLPATTTGNFGGGATTASGLVLPPGMGSSGSTAPQTA